MSGSFLINEDDNNIFIQSTNKDKSILAISKIDAEIILLNEETSKEIYMNNHYSIYGIMGILNICSVPCLIIITKVLDFSKGQNEIFKIIEIKHIILKKDIEPQKKIDIENNFKIYSENIIYLPIFFSNSFDMSNPYSKNDEEKNNLFLYNFDMLEPFYNEKNDKINFFCCKCIQGNSLFFQNKIGKIDIKFYLISKKKTLNEDIIIYQNEVIFKLSNGDYYNFIIYSSYNNKESNPFSVQKINKLNIVTSAFITDNLKLIEEETKKNYNIIDISKDCIEKSLEKIGYFYKKTTQIFNNSFYTENSCLQKSDCIIICNNDSEMVQTLKIIIFQSVLLCFQKFNIPVESPNNFYGYFYTVENKPKQNYLDLIDLIKFSPELNKFIIELNNIIQLKIPETTKPEISKFIHIKNEVNLNEIKIYILTYNLAGASSNYVKSDTSDFNLENLLFCEKHKDNISFENSPEIFCIGFQEIVELNVSNIVFKSNNSSVNPWTQKITNILFNKCKYQLIVKMSMVGILLLIFIKNSVLPFITELNVSSCKTGGKGILGNKGYIISHFNFKGKNFGFCSGHLNAGENKENLEQRQKEIKSIFDFNNFNSKNKFILNDFFFIFGDLNFKIDFYKEDITNENSIKPSEIIQYKDILLKRDELINFLSEFKNVKEGKINFLPTYKFIKHTDKYDLSKRIPAWTDRILFGNKNLNDINQIFYDSISEINISDHKPVSSLFEIKL